MTKRIALCFAVAALAPSLAAQPVLHDERGPYSDSRYFDMMRGAEYGPAALTAFADFDVTASSELAASGSGSYVARNVADAKPSTAWVEGTEGDGGGERVTLTFRSVDYPGASRLALSGFSVLNGYGKSWRTWERNGRVRDMAVSLNGRLVARVTLADSQTLQHVEFAGPVWVRPGDRLAFEIVSAYGGTHYEDTCVSEIEVSVDMDAMDS